MQQVVLGQQRISKSLNLLGLGRSRTVSDDRADGRRTFRTVRTFPYRECPPTVRAVFVHRFERFNKCPARAIPLGALGGPWRGLELGRHSRSGWGQIAVFTILVQYLLYELLIVPMGTRAKVGGVDPKLPIIV